MPTSPTGDQHAAGKRDRYQVQALAKGLRILSRFSEREPTLRMTELCERTDIPMPTLFRLVATLENEGYLERVRDGSYRPTTGVLALGFAALSGSELTQASEVPLQRLADLTGETVNLGTLVGTQVLYLVRVRNADLVTANIQVGSRLPAAYGSMGKILLAELDNDELDELLTDGGFPDGAGPNAVRSRTALAEQLKLVRERGYAIQDQEVAYGLRSIAAPVRDASDQVVAAANIAVQAAEYDIERMLNELKEPLLDTCRDISWRLGRRSQE